MPKESPGLFKRGLMRTFRRRKSGKALPEGAAQNSWGTFRGSNVARECRMALLWDDVGLKRFPRVLKESPGLLKTASMRTLQRRKRGKVLPEGAAQNCWGTFWGCNVALGCRAELLGNVTGL